MSVANVKRVDGNLRIAHFVFSQWVQIPSWEASIIYAWRALMEAWVGFGFIAATVFFSLRLADSNTNLNLSHFWFPIDSWRSCRTRCVSKAADATSSMLYPSDMSLKTEV